MANGKVVSEIMCIGRDTRTLTPSDKRRIVTLVEALAAKKGLGKALTTLWEKQKEIGFILGTPCTRENANDRSQFLCRKVGRYWLIHSPARKDRGNVPKLKRVGIMAKHARFVYESDDVNPYLHHPVEGEGFTRKCHLCSAAGAFPKEVLLPIELGKAGFLYGANFATLGHSHFTLWTEVPILQKYWPMDSLRWLCEHGDRLHCAEYSTFFNGLGAGNSLRHFHYQTLREPLPVFDAPCSRNFGASGIQRLEWPMPVYRLVVTRGNKRLAGLQRLDAFILAWLNMARHNTLNLAHRKDDAKNTHLIFIPRLDRDGYHHPKEITNDFAGCEVCGRINVENRQEWEQVVGLARKRQEPRQPPPDVDKMLRDIGPPDKAIERLESSLLVKDR